jgi:hypothetical protein
MAASKRRSSRAGGGAAPQRPGRPAPDTVSPAAVLKARLTLSREAGRSAAEWAPRPSRRHIRVGATSESESLGEGGRRLQVEPAGHAQQPPVLDSDGIRNRPQPAAPAQSTRTHTQRRTRTHTQRHTRTHTQRHTHTHRQRRTNTQSQGGVSRRDEAGGGSDWCRRARRPPPRGQHGLQRFRPL